MDATEWLGLVAAALVYGVPLWIAMLFERRFGQ